MDQIKNYGDARQTAACVYCGGQTETKDHVPSRILLDAPFPANLAVVPACEACNQAFSIDEEYVACLVECTVRGSVQGSSSRREKITRILRKRPALAARLRQARTVTANGVSFQTETDRVRNVVLKLARGHAAFELNEPQFEQPAHVAFAPVTTVPPDALTAFETPPNPSAWPEVGSRAMQRMATTFPCAPGWIVVQRGRYRYVASVSEGVVIRMVLSDYLACEVAWA